MSWAFGDVSSSDGQQVKLVDTYMLLRPVRGPHSRDQYYGATEVRLGNRTSPVRGRAYRQLGVLQA